jgi:hypothetical protein
MGPNSRTNSALHKWIPHTTLYIYIYIYICVCVCVVVFLFNIVLILQLDFACRYVVNTGSQDKTAAKRVSNTPGIVLRFLFEGS